MLAAFVTLTLIIPPVATYFVLRRLKRVIQFKNQAAASMFFFSAGFTIVIFSAVGLITLFVSISPEYHALMARI